MVMKVLPDRPISSPFTLTVAFAVSTSVSAPCKDDWVTFFVANERLGLYDELVE